MRFFSVTPAGRYSPSAKTVPRTAVTTNSSVRRAYKSGYSRISLSSCNLSNRSSETAIERLISLCEANSFFTLLYSSIFFIISLFIISNSFLSFVSASPENTSPKSSFIGI